MRAMVMPTRARGGHGGARARARMTQMNTQCRTERRWNADVTINSCP